MTLNVIFITSATNAHFSRRINMKRIVLTVAAIIGCAMACWSQAYYEASGQTQVFTLTPGAKSGPAASIRSGSFLHAKMISGIRVSATRGGIIIMLPALRQESADVALYNIAGRQMYRQRGYNGASLRLETRTFAPGVYSLIVRIEGQSYSRRITVTGKVK
jgi:hypothetical protein